MGFFGMAGARRRRRGFELYTAAVQAARDPVYFADLGVPDTLDGRFDLVGLFVALLIRRLRALELAEVGDEGAQAQHKKAHSKNAQAKNAQAKKAQDNKTGVGLAQAVFDAMFADMDFNLRELGVSDMAIGRRVRAMWEAFHGRALAYDGPLSAGDEAALTEALVRNVWRGSAENAGHAGKLAHAALAQDRHLAGQPQDGFQEGRVAFLPAWRALEAVA